MPKSKVVMLTSASSALEPRMFHREAQSLRQMGYEVAVVAPLDEDGFLLDTGGEKIDIGESTIQGIKIVGFRQQRSLFGKVQTTLNLLSLVTLGKIRLGANRYTDLIEKGVELNVDIYHCNDIWSLYAGIQIKRRLVKQGSKPKLIYDEYEYPAALVPSSGLIKHIYYKILRRINIHFIKEALKYVDYVITANQITRGYLLGINRFIQTEVIYNCPALSTFQEPADNMTKRDRISICHDGYLWFRRGLREMIEVMRLLKERYADKVELLIVGDVYGGEREYLYEKIKEYDLNDTIRSTGWLPYEKVGEAMSQADIGIIFLEPTENNMLAGPPNKLFNYMRYGLSVVSVYLPETSRIIREAQCGLIVKDLNIDNLVKALSTLIDNKEKRRQMGENGMKAVYDTYNWERMEKKLFSIYEELLQS